MANSKDNAPKTSSKAALNLASPPKVPSAEVLENIVRRIHAHAMSMIYLANHRTNIKKGDPKVGGHPSASSSALHLLSTLHLVAKNPQDYIACKPHASPTDHANNYLLNLLFEHDGKTRMGEDRARVAMRNLRHYSREGEPVFQSYHSAFDPDHWNYLPSGSVGIPPVNAIYLAHAYRMAETQGYKIPGDAHFWCIMGDSEFREGSLMEALPEASERGLGNVTWLVDYNRQSLDGHRILNEAALGGKDSDRIEKTALANGWDVVQLRHGKIRQKIFSATAAGEALKNVFENALPDYEFNSLLAKSDSKSTIEAVEKYDKSAAKALTELSEAQLRAFMADLGGHDIDVLTEAYENSKKDPEKPMLIVAHTVKGWGLRCAAQSGNHSAMLTLEEIKEIRERSGLKGDDISQFERFAAKSPEDQYLKARGDWTFKGISDCKGLREANVNTVYDLMKRTGAIEKFPTEVGINLKLVPMVHTQWMLGQITAKLTRIAETPWNDQALPEGKKPLSAVEKSLKAPAELVVTMAPDVGTSTNLNASMDGRIYGPEAEDFESEYGVKDTKTPDIVPHESENSRHLRFDIAEGNAMSCAGSYGKMAELTGVPFIPIMTVYDFFIKRALDQYFYNAYWSSSFICVGTPSGVTLSPEGAQHAWKSDIQIANSITWEPAFAVEMDWILTESFRRHLMTSIEGKDSPNGNKGRSAVIVRGATRALEHKEMLRRLRMAARFAGLSDEQILEATRKDCLEGAYYLVDQRGQTAYRPSENVVNIFAMGALVTEALQASDELFKDGIFANVIVVSSPDLLLGNLAEENNYRHLREGLGIQGDLYVNLGSVSAAKSSNGSNEAYPPKVFGPALRTSFEASSAGFAQALALAGRRVPVVSVHDGEAGLLDNIGSIVGTLHKTLAVRHHSKSGTPADIYHYHGIDAEAVAKASRKILEESALSALRIDARLEVALRNQVTATST